MILLWKLNTIKYILLDNRLPPKSTKLLASRVCTHAHQAEAKFVIIMEESEAASLHPAVLSRVSILHSALLNDTSRKGLGPWDWPRHEKLMQSSPNPFLVFFFWLEGPYTVMDPSWL